MLKTSLSIFSLELLFCSSTLIIYIEGAGIIYNDLMVSEFRNVTKQCFFFFFSDVRQALLVEIHRSSPKIFAKTNFSQQFI